MFKRQTPEIGPEFITRIDEANGEFRFSTQKADGLWYRVIPHTAREVFYLQMLPKGVKVLVPANGDGLLVRGDSVNVNL